MKYLLIGLFSLSGCVSLEYVDPDVQIVYTSPEKTVGVSIGSTQNDPIVQQVGEIIKSYNLREEK